MPKYHTIGEVSIPIACDREETEFTDETGRPLPGLMEYCPALGDEFFDYAFALLLTVEAEGEGDYIATHIEDCQQGWEVRGVQSVSLQGRKRGTKPGYPDQINRPLEPNDSARFARMYRDAVDNAELSADE